MDVKLIGAEEIKRTLKDLPNAVSHKIQQSAHMQAAKPLVRRAQQLAPIHEGDLSESIGSVKPVIKRAQFVGEVRVGPRRRRPYRGQAGHLVEFGTKRRFTKSGAHRGFMPKKPFMEPALNQTKIQVIGIIRSEMAKSVVKQMKKTLGRAFIR